MAKTQKKVLVVGAGAAGNIFQMKHNLESPDVIYTHEHTNTKSHQECPAPITFQRTQINST